MTYLYHTLPENMKGNIIYPLSQLRKKNLSAYKKEIRKYKGREWLPEDKIPYLNCKWKEVINLTAVDPIKINNSLKKTGRKSKAIKWYKINLKDLSKSKLIVFLHKENIPKIGYHDNPENFVRFNEKDLNKYNKLTKETIKYYKDSHKAGEKPLIFHLIPHILYKGSMNIKKSEIIE